MNLQEFLRYLLQYGRYRDPGMTTIAVHYACSSVLPGQRQASAIWVVSARSADVRGTVRIFRVWIFGIVHPSSILS
jgi:hypothetical protein